VQGGAADGTALLDAMANGQSVDVPTAVNVNEMTILHCRRPDPDHAAAAAAAGIHCSVPSASTGFPS